MNRKIVETKDGSHSIFWEEYDEHYHSIHGAIQESKHVFLKMGLEARSHETSLRIFEMGFGTGLNALLTALVAHSRGIPIDYQSAEAFPVDPEMIRELNYSDAIDDPLAKPYFELIHAGSWNEYLEVHPTFRLKKIHANLQELKLEKPVDLIYYDAFAPSAQPELWTESVFRQMFNFLNPGGILVTYCAKGDVRRAMISAGLEAERLPGPPGKREMLRARKPLPSH